MNSLPGLVVFVCVFLFPGAVFADLFYEELSTMDMGKGLTGEEQIEGVNMPKMATGGMNMAKNLEFKAKVWLKKDRKKFEEGMTKEAQKSTMQGMTGMMDYSQYGISQEQMKAAMKQEEEKAIARKPDMTIVRTDKKEWITLDNNKNNYDKTSFQAIISKDKMDKAFREQFDKYSTKAKPQEWAILVDESDEEEPIAGITCKKVTFDAQVKLGPEAGKMAGKNMSAMKLEVWLAPSLKEAAKEFFDFETALAKELGKITKDGKSQLDFLYKSDEPWAKEMVRKMQSIKGFPVKRVFSTTGGEQREEDTKEILDAHMGEDDNLSPEIKAGIEQSRAESLRKRQMVIKDPSKGPQMEAEVVQSYIKNLGMTKAQAAKEAKIDLEAFLKDPKYYDALMKKMMGLAKKQAAKKTGKLAEAFKMSFIQEISKINTQKINDREFEIPSGYKKK